MEKFRQIFIDGKMEIFNDETNYLTNKNKSIMDIYNLVTNASDELSKKNCKNDIYLLMSEYLPLDMCPFMREYLRLQFDFVDSFTKFDEKDLYNIKMANILLFKALFKYDREFPQVFSEAIPDPDSEQDEFLLEMATTAKNIIDRKVRLKTYEEFRNTSGENKEIFTPIEGIKESTKNKLKTKKNKMKEEIVTNETESKINSIQKKIDEKLIELNKLQQASNVNQQKEGEKSKIKRGRKKKEE